MSLNENRTTLTFDRDFGELVFKLDLKPKAGIVYFRWEGFQPEDPGNFVLDLLSKGIVELTEYFTVIGKENIRQRIIK